MLHIGIGCFSFSFHFNTLFSKLGSLKSPSFGGVGEASYSYLSASTGFLVAAFQLCQLICLNFDYFNFCDGL